MEKKLQRIPQDGAVAGVCAGLGAYLGVDKTWVRLVFIISVFFSGYMGIGLLGPIVYIILWIVLPVKSLVLPNDPFDVNYRAPQMATDHFQPTRKKSNDRYVAGLILLALGLFFLMHQLDVFYWRDFARFWPVLIIVIGLACVVSAFNQRKQPSHLSDVDTGDDSSDNPPAEDNGEEQAFTK